MPGASPRPFLEALLRRPDLLEHEPGLLRMALHYLDRINDETRLLEDRCEDATTLDRMLDKVRDIWRRCHGSNVVVVSARPRYEDDPVAAEPERGVVG